MTDDELARYASADPNNAAGFVPRPRSLSLADFLERASGNLRRALASGAFRQDPTPAFYVYGIRYVPPDDIREALPADERRPEYLLLGLVGALPFERLAHGLVALHERTFADRVAERVALTEATGMSFAPILAGYHAADHRLNDRLEGLLGIDRRRLAFEGARPPVVEATLGETTHRLWRIDDPSELEALAAATAPLRLLILDGHHRFTAAARRFYDGRPSAPLVMLVDGEDRALRLLPWHRVLPARARAFPALIEAARLHFDAVLSMPGPLTAEAAIERLHRMRASGVRGFVAASRDAAYEVHGPASEDAGADFDLLHGFLDDILELDPEDLQFVRSPRRALELARGSGPDDAGTAILLPGLSARGVEQRAFERGQVMAEKSTMFLPKVAEGVLFASAGEAARGPPSRAGPTG